jgi:hypothetical protein
MYCDLYGTDETVSSSDDWFYYQVVTHLQYYISLSVSHNLQFSIAVFFHHELPS